MGKKIQEVQPSMPLLTSISYHAFILVNYTTGIKMIQRPETVLLTVCLQQFSKIPMLYLNEIYSSMINNSFFDINLNFQIVVRLNPIHVYVCGNVHLFKFYTKRNNNL